MPLREDRKELRMVLDHISDGVLFIDGVGDIRFYNNAFADMFSVRQDITGAEIFKLPDEDSLKEGIFRVDKDFPGPFCWERNKCPEDTKCPGRTSQFCRCWLLPACGQSGNGGRACRECLQYKSVRSFLEKPKELEIGERMVSVLSTFIEYSGSHGIWEVIVFKDVTDEKLDAAVKIAGAAAHELRQPLQVITSCAALLKDVIPDDPESREILQTMKESCNRMNNIIEKIGHITRYRTKTYIRNYKILDLDESSDEV